MVAIVRLEGYEKLAYMRHLSVKATGRRTGCNSNPNSYQVQWENLCFSNLPNKAFYPPEWHTCSTIGFKGHTWAISCDTGHTESGILILFHQKLSQFIYPMVHGEPWDLQEIGSMVNWGCRGLQGVKNTLSVALFSILFSAVLFLNINPEMTCNPFNRELTSTTNKRNNLSIHLLVCCRLAVAPLRTQ